MAWAHVVAAKLNRKQDNLQLANDHISQIQVVLNHSYSWNPLTRALAYSEWFCLNHALEQDQQSQYQSAFSILTALNTNHPLIAMLENSQCQR